MYENHCLPISVFEKIKFFDKIPYKHFGHKNDGVVYRYGDRKVDIFYTKENYDKRNFAGCSSIIIHNYDYIQMGKSPYMCFGSFLSLLNENEKQEMLFYLPEFMELYLI